MTDSHPTSFAGVTPTPGWAFAQYQMIRPGLPAGLPRNRQPQTVILESLAPVIERFEVFVFDAFGVLNAGHLALPEAVNRIRQLQQLGKTVVILSNAATARHSALVNKYQRMGFDITPDQLVSSRLVLEQFLYRQPQTGRFGVISPASSAPDTLPIDWVPVRAGTRLETLDKLDGFVFLSSECWNTEIHQALALSLTRFARPVYVANPDLVAPRGGHLTLEPGYFAQLLMEQCGLRFDFFGKPYKAAFDAVLQRLERTDPGDILMVGDTLHTDILGGQAAGMKTMLITAHGALKGMDIARCIEESGIVPDYVAPMI